MNNVLNSKIADNDKWLEYNQVLQRYLHFIGKNRQPLNIRLHDISSSTPSAKTFTEEKVVKSEVKHERLPEDEILSTVPQKYRKKADNFIRLLNKSGDLAWDTKGVVSIKGEIIPQSNIVDLLNDALRARKTSNPHGWEQFAGVIKEINVPHELIGNPKRRDVSITNHQTSPALQLKRLSEYDYDGDTEEKRSSKVTHSVDSFHNPSTTSGSIKKHRRLNDSDKSTPKNIGWERLKL